MAQTPGSDAAIAETWSQGKGYELEFWRMVATNTPPCPPDYHAEIVARCNPEAEIHPAFIARIVTAPLDEAVLLDIAAGPVSSVGWKFEGRRLNVVPIDALAEDYAAILAEAGLRAPVPTRPGHAEDLASIFPPASIDFAHMRNALDHCYDPMKVIRGALTVLKPGATFRIDTIVNEAVIEGYQGFHQWNIERRGDRLVIWRPGIEHDVAAELPHAEVTLDGGEHWLFIHIRRLA
ncbi:MAG: hypothetical protein JWP04_2451 [Belnapia sp.]|nr:hypothetical protein [Belnapia sp.]